MPRANADVPDTRKLRIRSLPIIPAGTMIPARGIPFDRGRVRVAHPTSASVRQCPPILSAAVRRKREIDSPSGVHQEGRADGANGWIRTGTTVPDSDSRGAAAALALPAQNRKTNIWSGGHWRTSPQIWVLGKTVWNREKLFCTSADHQVPGHRTQYQIDRESISNRFPTRRARHL